MGEESSRRSAKTLPMPSAIACRRSQAPVASDPMLLVVAHRSRLLAAISTSPAATLTLRAGLCFWLRPTVSTLGGLVARRPAAAVTADRRSSEKFELCKLGQHRRAMGVAELPQGFCVQHALQFFGASLDPHHLGEGNTPQLRRRRAEVEIELLAGRRQITAVAAKPAPGRRHCCPARQVLETHKKRLAAKLGSDLVLSSRRQGHKHGHKRLEHRQLDVGVFERRLPAELAQLRDMDRSSGRCIALA